MERDIKDYLHLYIGCDISTPYGVCKFLYFRSDVNKYRNPVIVDRGDNVFAFELKEVSLILRPLSDMAEREKKDLSVILRAAKDGNNLLPPIPAGRHLNLFMNAEDPKAVKFLLSCGFDLFNLIPDGLAIDATTISKPV